MTGRRILYLAAVGGCMVFYLAYREWFSWFALVGVLCLPWLSLLLSLPAMLSLRLRTQCPTEAQMGEAAVVTLVGECRLPQPLLRGKLRILHAISGQQTEVKDGGALPTEHCGQINIQPVKAWVYDYLGLFRLPVRRTSGCAMLVRPKSIALTEPPDLSRYRENAWKPKSGGGFAENHELRLYRPGDNLRQIHWKLSAKTGKLILREPMEPVRGLAVLVLELNGAPEEIDRKLGLLTWLSGYLLQQEVPHRIVCLTGQGQEAFSVEREEDLPKAIDALLRAPSAKDGETALPVPAAWQYHIGGRGYEG